MDFSEGFANSAVKILNSVPRMRTYLERTSAVGSYAKSAPHAWGLSDVSGNVWEICDNLYIGEEKDRVIRGGSFVSGPADCRVAGRSNNPPGYRSGGIGFRVAIY